MKVNKIWIILGLIVAVGIIFLLLGPLYIVNEGEQAVITRFGEVVGVEIEAGLKYKTPLIETVKIYPKKILSWDGDAKKLLTRAPELENIWVDATARWRIVDPKKFYSRLGSIEAGQSRMDSIIDSEVRTVLAKHFLREVVRNSNIINEIQRKGDIQIDKEVLDELQLGTSGSENTGTKLLSLQTTEIKEYEKIGFGRQVLMDFMFDEAEKAMYETQDVGDGKTGYVLDEQGKPINQFGIELIDIIIRDIKYPKEIEGAVYNRMIKDREQIAEFYKSIGEGVKADWAGKKARELDQIYSSAERLANEIKGQANADVTRIYADAYNRDPAFFEYWRALQSYKEILPKFRKTLTTDPDYFKYLYNQSGR